MERRGNLHKVICLSYGWKGPLQAVLDHVRAGEEDPPCAVCGGSLKSDTISFGDDGIIAAMDKVSQRGKLVTRVIRAGERAPAKRAENVSTPETRMEAVWDLTLMCLAWRREPVGELRLQRSVVRIQRARR